MIFAEVQEAYENMTEPLKVHRKSWPDGDVAVYDGDGVEKICGGEQCMLSEEDFEADDWVVVPHGWVQIPSVGDVD